jgi:DNA modification methylase
MTIKGKHSLDIEQLIQKYLPYLSLEEGELKKALPALAKDEKKIGSVHAALREVPTTHRLYRQDARFIDHLADESIQLVVTSPPYWTLKHYNESEGQLGSVRDFDTFLNELEKVWAQGYRLLVPGGRMIIVVGDVCLSRKDHGRHAVVPLHASIQERCRQIGFDNLAPIIWYKITNAKFEVQNGSSFLGKPYEPNAIIKNDIEYIIMQRKPGGYRNPTPAMRVLSVISEENHRAWFQQIWKLPGASTRSHPAPFPLELAARLIRMFSFVGDTVLDPFMGTGTTNVAAAQWGRHSIGVEIDRRYFDLVAKRLEAESDQLFGHVAVEVYER